MDEINLKIFIYCPVSNETFIDIYYAINIILNSHFKFISVNLIRDKLITLKICLFNFNFIIYLHVL